MLINQRIALELSSHVIQLRPSSSSDVKQIDGAEVRDKIVYAYIRFRCSWAVRRPHQKRHDHRQLCQTYALPRHKRGDGHGMFCDWKAQCTKLREQ